MKVSSLEEVLSYRNPFVTERFVSQFNVEAEDAEEIFRETLKMLWLMAKQKEEQKAGLPSVPEKILVYHQMNVIDEMWHAFILFSHDYTEFCHRYFGFYLHHLPTTSEDRKKEHDAREADPERFQRESRTAIEKQCVYTSEKLGPGTLTRWFKEYPTRFPAFLSPGAEA